MSAWSEAEYKEYCNNQTLIKIDKNMQKQNKYKNKKVTYYNIEFDSKKEGARFLQLQTMEEDNQIAELELQPKFILQEGFRDKDGKWHRPITYSADFKYKEGGKVVIEDVKASKKYKTEVYRIKKKLLLYKNQDINFREVY